MSGYRPAHPGVYRAWNLVLVLPLLLLTLPLIIVIAAALAVTQGPTNVFYRGPRLGLGGKVFHIIKFKTLRDEAAQLTQDQVLPPDSKMETLLGKHLRDTRLDELPQLFNVLMGDMNMLGPRPVRPSIAENCRRIIPNYDVRFQVVPGLVGYTQALMPHGTDKAIRARVNAMLCTRRVNLLQELLFVSIAGLAVVAWTWRVSVASLRRGVQRTIAGEAVLNIGGERVPMRLVSVDGEKVVLESGWRLPEGGRPYELTLRRRFRFCGCRKAARCTAILLGLEEAKNGLGYRYSLRYAPVSPFHQYLVDRYIVGKVLVN